MDCINSFLERKYGTNIMDKAETIYFLLDFNLNSHMTFLQNEFVATNYFALSFP